MKIHCVKKTKPWFSGGPVGFVLHQPISQTIPSTAPALYSGQAIPDDESEENYPIHRPPKGWKPRAGAGIVCKADPKQNQMNQDAAARPRKIVVVDDVAVILEMFTLLLRAKFKDAVIDTFQDSNEAWQRLSVEDPDLLIVRDRMLGLTGEEIVQRLVALNVTYPIVVGGSPPTQRGVVCAASCEVLIAQKISESPSPRPQRRPLQPWCCRNKNSRGRWIPRRACA